MTLYVFDTGVPAANDNPSEDQPDMLTNNMSTNGLIGTDHITFNIDNGGQHKQVTFNQDAAQGFPYVPTLPATPPVLFTYPVNGLSQLLYYTGTAAQSSTQYVTLTNGSVLLLAGIIMKWGVVTLPGTGFNQSVPFVNPFPNNCFSVVASNAQITSVTLSSVVAFNTNGFTAVKSSSSGTLTISYIAIGN
jgi:hypothetical protein